MKCSECQKESPIVLIDWRYQVGATDTTTTTPDTPERDRRYCPDCRPESRVPGQRILCGGAEPELPVRRKIDRPAWSDASRNYVMPTAPGEKIRIAHG